MAKGIPSSHLKVRKAALAILSGLEDESRVLDRLMEDLPQVGSLKTREDRAFLNAIVFGTLRWRARLDHLLAHFSETPIRKVRPDVLNLLRMALFQVVFMDRVPPALAVSAAVEIAKGIGPHWVSGYVNGLLRRAAAEHDRVPLPGESEDPVAHLSVKASFPPWLVRRWIDRFGIEGAAARLDAVNAIPPLTVRTNGPAAERATLLAELAGEALEARATPYSTLGIQLTGLRRPLPEMPAFQKGGFQVQDEAAQLVGFLLDPRPGEIVLDACAGLGGKTGHLAQLMENSGRLTAVDRDEGRLRKLEAEMRRLGAAIVVPCRADLDGDSALGVGAGFDRILLDAPCSGLGVLRRNPDGKGRAREAHLPDHHRRQTRFLARLAPLVKPGGALVYAVCSGEPEENEAVVEEFLKAHPSFRVAHLSEARFFRESALPFPGPFLKTDPHLHGTDGFFGARLHRMK